MSHPRRLVLGVSMLLLRCHCRWVGLEGTLGIWCSVTLTLPGALPRITDEGL